MNIKKHQARRPIFQFVCISSVTRNNPFDPDRQVLLDHTDPNVGLTKPSAACVDFAPSVEVTVDGQRHVLPGVHRLTQPNCQAGDL